MLAEGIAKNTSLLKLNLKKNRLSSVSGAWLIQALKRNTNMEYLNVEDNQIGFTTQAEFKAYLAKNISNKHHALVPKLLTQRRTMAAYVQANSAKTEKDLAFAQREKLKR